MQSKDSKTLKYNQDRLAINQQFSNSFLEFIQTSFAHFKALATGSTQPESLVGDTLADNRSDPPPPPPKNLTYVCQFLIPHRFWWLEKTQMKTPGSYMLR